MPLQYLPIMAKNSAPQPPRVLVSPSKQHWCEIAKPLKESKIALLSSAALRLVDQPPFIPREDFSFRHVPPDPQAGEIIIDHHSGIGRVPKQDPEMVFPRTALTRLVEIRAVGPLAPFHLSFMGGLRDHGRIETELAPALAEALKQARVDLALLVP